MEPRLIQSQSQRLILSPQIRQYLRLLKLPALELEQAVEAELADNPLLEEMPPSSDTAAEGPAEIAAEENHTEEVRIGEHFEGLDNFDDEGNYAYDGSGADTGALQKKRDYQASLISREEALSDYLLWQIRFLDLSEQEKTVAYEVIGNLNDNGLLQATADEIAASCGFDSGMVAEIISKLQLQLEPPGIAAQSLQQALLLQLQRKEHPDNLAITIVRDHLPLLEKRDWPQLARILNTDIERVRQAGVLIAGLEPRPGRTFFSDESLAVTPDATVSESDEEGERYHIEIHNERIPELRVNHYYRKMLRDKTLDQKTREFLKEKAEAALNFIRALRQRKSTIRQITEAVVEAQADFFDHGFSHLKPLRLKDIANQLGIHESTVSRAMNNKYIATPQGTIPYRSFFSSRLDTVTGPAESQKSIMEKIKGLIQKESPDKPLSDQELVRLIQQDGVRIARRTVAKYRELLKILPSHMRRKR